MNNIQSLTIQKVLPNEKLLVAIFAIPLIVASLNTATLLFPRTIVDSPTSDEKLLIGLTNQERIERGLDELNYNPELYSAAEAKAQDILANGYFDHVSPTGKTPWAFINEAGYDYLKAGENLAINFQTVDGPIPAWMQSPTHRANILKPDYEEIGIAEVKGEYKGRETTVVVQMFGTKPFSTKRFTKEIVKSITSPLPF